MIQDVQAKLNPGL